MASTIAADAAQQAKAQLMKSQRTPSGAASLPQFYAGLRDRNVDFSISEDDARQMIKDMLSVPARFEVSDEEEANWKLDLLKCEREQEAVFQRTIMMDAISRHKLGDLLDYTCESPWTCDPMPRRNSGEPYKMALPKPDLAIAFKSRAIISPFAWPNLRPFMKYICPEAYKEGKADRVFHFFSLEVKGANFNPGDFIGVRQNLNAASQALHNMWTFMKIANQESTFFKDVRFFSATATSAGFQFRVHRAVMVGEDERIENDYPLGFHFDEIFRTDANYKRSDVSVVVQNILFEYGVKTLLPILKSAVTAVLKKVRKNAELQSALGKRPAEETIDSFNTQRQAIGAFQLDNSQDSVLGQTIAA